MTRLSTTTTETSTDRRTTVALKEWALVCEMLLDGGMTVLFRKGGIDEKGFWVEAPEFMLFPTYFHQNRDKVRPEYVARFDAALGLAPAEGTIAIPGFARVVDAIEVRRPDAIGELEDLHPYTRQQIDMRLAFRPKKPLVVLACHAFRLEDPTTMRARDEFGGCTSWVPLPVDIEARGAEVTTRAQVESVAARVRATVG